LKRPEQHFSNNSLKNFLLTRLLFSKIDVMEPAHQGSNPGEKENEENMGIPGRERESISENLDAGQESLPSDGPVSQSEGTDAPDLQRNREQDDPGDLREDSDPV
jgi:hypothetical protein